MPPPDLVTIQNLRRDLALQIARYIKRTGVSQLAAAQKLAIPQPTLSKIVNGRVNELSLELLIRIAVRAGLAVVLQTGREPREAGAFVSGTTAPERTRQSRIGNEAREAAARAAWGLSPEQRLEAHLNHSRLVTAFHAAGRPRRPGAAAVDGKSRR